jgi:hypothetical protein
MTYKMKNFEKMKTLKTRFYDKNKKRDNVFNIYGLLQHAAVRIRGKNCSSLQTQKLFCAQN